MSCQQIGVYANPLEIFMCNIFANIPNKYKITPTIKSVKSIVRKPAISPLPPLQFGITLGINTIKFIVVNVYKC
jgi:hypothetical protein